MNWLLLTDWVAVLKLVLGMANSIVFFRLYSAHDYREIIIRLLRSKYENLSPEDLEHAGRHLARVLFSISLGLIVAGFTWSLIPATLAVAGAGYLIFDPTLNHDRGLTWDYAGNGNNWDRFWMKLTKRDTTSGRWSAYVEAALLLANIIWFICLSRLQPGTDALI